MRAWRVTKALALWAPLSEKAQGAVSITHQQRQGFRLHGFSAGSRIAFKAGVATSVVIAAVILNRLS